MPQISAVEVAGSIERRRLRPTLRNFFSLEKLKERYHVTFPSLDEEQ